MGFFARTMRDVSEFLGEEEDFEDYEEQYEAIVGNIEDLHWSEDEQMYCDVSVDEDGELSMMYPDRSRFLMRMTLMQTSPTMFATEATSRYSRSCSPCCRQTRLISVRRSSSCAIPSNSGRRTASGLSVRVTRSSAKARTTGAGRSGSR